MTPQEMAAALEIPLPEGLEEALPTFGWHLVHVQTGYPPAVIGALPDEASCRASAAEVNAAVPSVQVEASEFNTATFVLQLPRAACVLPEPAGAAPALVLLAVLARRRR